MDETDFRLLAALVREPLASMADLARTVGLTRNAVAARHAKLVDKGVLYGAYAWPHPALFGRRHVLAVYAPPPRPVAPARILAVEDVVGYSFNHDDQVAVTFLGEGPDGPRPAGLDDLLGGPPPRVFLREHARPPPRERVLGPEAWRLMAELVEDARIPSRLLAERLGVSERVAAKRRRELRERGCVEIATSIMPNLSEGIVLYHLFVMGQAGVDEAAVRRELGWSVVEDRTGPPPGLFIFCRAATVGDALAARDRVARLPGVVHAEVVLQKEGGVAKQRVRRLCAAEAARVAEALGRR